jgi:hypothetical protein
MIPVVCSLSPGSSFRSNTRTRNPRRASTVAHASPAKLAPTIVQSTEVELEEPVKRKPDGKASERKIAGTRSFVRQMLAFGSHDEHSDGAAPMTVVTHIAIRQQLDGKASTR